MSLHKSSAAARISDWGIFTLGSRRALPGVDAGQRTMVSDLQRHDGTVRGGIYYTLQTVARQSADTPTAPQSPLDWLYRPVSEERQLFQAASRMLKFLPGPVSRPSSFASPPSFMPLWTFFPDTRVTRISLGVFPVNFRARWKLSSLELVYLRREIAGSLVEKWTVSREIFESLTINYQQ